MFSLSHKTYDVVTYARVLLVKNVSRYLTLFPILWTVILLIIIYLLGLKFASRCFDRTVKRIQECQKSTPDVLVPTSSNFTAKDIPSNLDKRTGVSTQTLPKSHRY